MPEVEVHLWAGLRSLIGGQEKLRVEATTIGEMLSELVANYPSLKSTIDSGVSVAIDGRIISTGVNEKIIPENEIFLMQRLRGG